MKPPLEYKVVTFITKNQLSKGYNLFNHLTEIQKVTRVTEMLYSFILVLEGKSGKEITESSRSDFLEKFLANSFALSDGEGNTIKPLDRRYIADLPLLRTLLFAKS